MGWIFFFQAITRDSGKENLVASECPGPSGIRNPGTPNVISNTPTSPSTPSRFASPYSLNDSTRGARPLRPTCTEVTEQGLLDGVGKTSIFCFILIQYFVFTGPVPTEYTTAKF